LPEIHLRLTPRLKDQVVRLARLVASTWALGEEGCTGATVPEEIRSVCETIRCPILVPQSEQEKDTCGVEAWWNNPIGGRIGAHVSRISWDIGSPLLECPNVTHDHRVECRTLNHGQIGVVNLSGSIIHCQEDLRVIHNRKGGRRIRVGHFDAEVVR
jgi:hypothetical protein